MTIQDHTRVHSLPEAPHQNGGQTDRHTDRHTDRQTDTQNLWNLEVLTHLKTVKRVTSSKKEGGG